MAIIECRKRAADAARYVGDCQSALNIAREIMACESNEDVAQRFGKHDDWDTIKHIAVLASGGPPDHLRLAWVPSHLIDLSRGNVAQDKTRREKLLKFLGAGGDRQDLEGNMQADVIASECASNLLGAPAALHEAVVAAT